MEQLRKASRITAAIELPAAIFYAAYIIQNPAGPASRAEAAIRALLAVGAVGWVILYASRAIFEAVASRYAVRARVRVLQESTVALPMLPSPRSGLDPQVMELGRRISGQLHAPDMRQND